MSSGGGNPVDQIENSLSEQFTSFMTNPRKYLAETFDPETAYKRAIHNEREFWGELSGSNKARSAGYAAADQKREADAAFAKQQADLQMKNKQADVQASSTAQAARATAAAQSNQGFGGTPSASNTSAPERDFLGL